MITSKQDALWALKTLFGTTTPRLLDLSTRELDFIEGFVNPVIKASEERVVLGYAWIPEKIDSGLPRIAARPTHVLPTGHAIHYYVPSHSEHGNLCGQCASCYPDGQVDSWDIGWDDNIFNCDKCGRRIEMLSMMEESEEQL